MAFRPLGLVKDMLGSMGLELTYAYDDLIFVSHNAFLLQFDDESETVGMFVNVECPQAEVDALVLKTVQAGAAVELKVVMRGRYEMKPNEDDETFSLHFS